MTPDTANITPSTRAPQDAPATPGPLACAWFSYVLRRLIPRVTPLGNQRRGSHPRTTATNHLRHAAAATLILSFLLLTHPTLADTAPRWAVDAVWYQIFPERFRNGDPSNDPDRTSLEGTWPYFAPEGWKTSPWTSDWYELQPGEQDGKGFYVHAQLRRYGGDLQGIIDKLDYLKDLGVTALYLNPIFESPSLHKYGATLFHHVDKHFGPDPAGDLKRFSAEDPADPATWRWTEADKLFLRLIQEVHRRNMRIIIDGVFNHVGIPFWALQRARREGPTSRFAAWFHITRWDDPATPKDEFTYQGWSGIQDLPELARTKANLHPDVRTHLHHVVRRWMDPNGDGDPRDGIDGWRLDVAAEVPIGFWREFRGWVKAINPHAYITGEIWWDDYKTVKLRNAAPWLKGPFDGVMNYRFADSVYQFFNQPDPITATDFARLLTSTHRDYGYRRSLGLQNLLGSHDTARIGSMVVNSSHRMDHGANVQDNRTYSVRPPTAAEKQRWKQMVAFQFLSPGAPYIYYGDEVGMWGADDPDCRKPMLWPDLQYSSEKAHPFGRPSPGYPVSIDQDLLAFYRSMARMRAKHATLRTGRLTFMALEDDRRMIAFRRDSIDTTGAILALFNASDNTLGIAPRAVKLTSFRDWQDLQTGTPLPVGSLDVPPRGFRILATRAP